MLYYFAYGSNLHPVRLTERVPSASWVGSVKLNSYRLYFHKSSQDGSGKCNIVATEQDDDYVFGAIYQIKPEQKTALDRHEGLGFGYQDQSITISHQGVDYPCFTYLALSGYIDNSLKPYYWYKSLVALGAEYLQFPKEYIARIDAIQSQADPDLNRQQRHDVLIQKMKTFL